jgi:MoaA/NifB/PqqE/SkfB family radical SAM enzyme
LRSSQLGKDIGVSDLALPYVVAPITNPELERAKYANFFKALKSRRERITQLHSGPFDLTIDLTSTCHLQCPYCSTGAGTLKRQKSIMKDQLYFDLLRQVGNNCFVISYFSNGEPLLHKKFGELVGSVQHQEVFSIISTNLSLELSDRYLRQLLTSGLGIISVSLDGATRETYSQYRRGGDFDLVVRNMRRLVELKKELGSLYPLIEWRFLRFQHNEHEEEAARTLAAQIGVDLLEFWPGSAPPIGSFRKEGVYRCSKPLAGPAISGPALTRLASRQRATRKLARMIPKIVVGGEAEIGSFTRKCDWLYFGGMIHPDGRIGPCCVSNHDVDDFAESIDQLGTIEGAFNSVSHIEARSMFATGAISHTVCQKCPQPRAQHYQFRMKLRSILRNAPDWAVRILAKEPDAHFLPEDKILVPEVGAIVALGAWAHPRKFWNIDWRGWRLAKRRSGKTRTT